MSNFTRIVCIVLDGVGVGEAPDAAAFGDAGSNSIGNTARAVGGLSLPVLGGMGLGNILDIDGVPPVEKPRAHWGRLTPASPGKDSTIGHWELMGCIPDAPLPTYPDGFPDEVIRAFEARTGRRVIGNRTASGTAIIQELGDAQRADGDLIVYTSQDSVFQVAAHEEVVPVDELYRCCGIAREILAPPHAVGRVIARPFRGSSGGYFRTPRRRDFSVDPPAETVLDLLSRAGRLVKTIGKIDDLFAGRGIAESAHTRDNHDGMARTLDAIRVPGAEFVFTNLVDFDTMWGHRNDARAYALGLEEFDSFLGEFVGAMGDGDLLIVTSDHGNDPTTPSTDHSREYVPLIAYHNGIVAGRTLGTRDTLADVGATVADALGAQPPAAGRSFLGEV